MYQCDKAMNKTDSCEEIDTSQVMRIHTGYVELNRVLYLKVQYIRVDCNKCAYLKYLL